MPLSFFLPSFLIKGCVTCITGEYCKKICTVLFNYLVISSLFCMYILISWLPVSAFSVLPYTTTGTWHSFFLTRDNHISILTDQSKKVFCLDSLMCHLWTVSVVVALGYLMTIPATMNACKKIPDALALGSKEYVEKGWVVFMALYLTVYSNTLFPSSVSH